MRSTVLLYISLIILSAIAGCSSPTHRELLRAESVMSHDPALALAILDSLSDAPSLATDRNSRFLYNLLLTEARYKNYLPFEGDSLIILTAEYYRKKGDRNRLMRILYLKGRCEFEKTEYSKSAVSAQKVLKLASSIGDTLFMAKAEALLSHIYSYTYNSKEELVHAHKAAELYKAAGKMDNYLFSLVDKARALENNHLSSASISLLDSILTLIQPSDTMLRIYIEESKIHSLLSEERSLDAYMLMDSIQKIANNTPYYIPPTDILETAFAVKEYETVKRGIDSLLRADTAMLSDMSFLYVAYDYYKESNKLDSALLYKDNISAQQNNMLASSLKHGVAIAQMDYFSAEAENEKRHSEFIFLIASFIIFGILLITIISVLYFRNLMLRKSIEKAELLDKISGLIVELGDNEVRLKEISEETEHLISSQNRDIVEKEEEIRRLSGELALLKNV